MESALAEPSSDHDSTFGDTLSENRSVHSGILAHRMENGRQYHACMFRSNSLSLYKDGRYLFPNDEQEGDRLDILHHIHLAQLNNKLHLAPLPEDFCGQVLDIGAGTGLWCLDMGDSYPAATIRGVDLSPTLPDMVPLNVFFEMDDVEETWTFTIRFDFLHCRSMAGSIRNWPYLVEQCFDNLNPGGWVELADWDYTPFLPDGTPDTRDNNVVRWHRLMMDTCLGQAGATAKPGPDLRQWAVEAGFEDVKEVVFYVPIGGWAKDPKLKEVGRFYKFSLDDGLEGISLRTFTQLAGMALADAYTTISSFRQSIRMKDSRFYHKFYIVIGRKPGAK